MTSIDQQIKNSFIYLIPMFVINILPLLTLSIFTRILTPIDYGLYALAQVYGTFAAGMANIGLVLGFERSFFQYKNSKKRFQILYSVLVFVCINLILFGVITFLSKNQIAIFMMGSPEYGDFIFIAFCACAINSLTAYYLVFFKNYENAKANVKYTIIDTLIYSVISFILIVFIRTGINGFFWGQIISGIVVLTMLTSKFLSMNSFSFSWLMLRECLKIGYPLTPVILLKIVNTNFDKYMLSLLSSIGGVGIYNIGQKISTLVFTYMTALQKVFSPQVYKHMFDSGEEGGKYIGNYLTPFIYVLIAAAMILSLFSEEIIIMLTPPIYHNAKIIVIILSMYYGVLFFGKQPQLEYAKKTHVTSILYMLSIFLNIGLNIPFIYKWGIYGAAWATFIAGFISIVISFFLAQYYYRIKWEYLKIFLIYGLFFGSSVTMILLYQFSINYFVCLIFKIIFLTLYFLLGIKIQIITAGTLALVKKNILPRF